MLEFASCNALFVLILKHPVLYSVRIFNLILSSQILNVFYFVNYCHALQLITDLVQVSIHIYNVLDILQSFTVCYLLHIFLTS